MVQYFSHRLFCQVFVFLHDKQAKLHFPLHIFTSSRRAQNSPIRHEHNRARCPQLLSSAEVDGVLQRILIRSGRRLRKHSFSQRSCGAGAGDQGVPRSWHSTQCPRQPRYEGSTSPLRMTLPSATHLANYIPFILSEEVRKMIGGDVMISCNRQLRTRAQDNGRYCVPVMNVYSFRFVQSFAHTKRRHLNTQPLRSWNGSFLFSVLAWTRGRS